MTNCKTNELNRLAHDAQITIKHTRIDLAGFLVLDADARAARWRGFDRLAKFDLVCQQLAAKYGSWEHEEVEYGIATYDRKWGSEPLTTEAATDAALERLADTDQQSARNAPTDHERSYFKRSSAAYRKARLYWRAGLRPQPVRGGWLVPSQQRAGTVHQVRRDGCSCEAGQQNQPCWHAALITGIETASDDMQRFADPVEVVPAPYLTAAQLGQKLAAQRARVSRKEVVDAVAA